MQEKPYEIHDYAHLVATLKNPEQVVRYGLHDNLEAVLPMPRRRLKEVTGVLMQALQMSRPGPLQKIRHTLQAEYVNFEQSITHGSFFRNGIIPRRGASLIWMHKTSGPQNAAAEAQEFIHVAELIQNAGVYAVVLGKEKVDGKMHVWHINPPKSQVKSGQRKN